MNPVFSSKHSIADTSSIYNCLEPILFISNWNDVCAGMSLPSQLLAFIVMEF